MLVLQVAVACFSVGVFVLLVVAVSELTAVKTSVDDCFTPTCGLFSPYRGALAWFSVCVLCGCPICVDDNPLLEAEAFGREKPGTDRDKT